MTDAHIAGRLFIAIPLPPFHRWQLLDRPEECPDGYVIIARLATQGPRGTPIEGELVPATAAHSCPACGRPL